MKGTLLAGTKQRVLAVRYLETLPGRRRDLVIYTDSYHFGTTSALFTAAHVRHFTPRVWIEAFDSHATKADGPRRPATALKRRRFRG